MRKLILVLLFPAICLAEPGPTALELMNRPASMFDIGMVRLHYWLTSWAKDQAQGYWKHYAKSERYIDVNANYVPEKDKITVSVTARDLDIGEDQMRTGCGKALEPIMVIISKGIPGLFQSHSAPEDPEEFSRLRKGLLEMIDLRCTVYGTGSHDVRYIKSVAWTCADGRCTTNFDES